tara:strand:- start:4664 stop:5053 length:390 start_codon:yes stop_codon:yes gene_type:complete
MGRKRRSLIGTKFANRSKYSAIRKRSVVEDSTLEVVGANTNTESVDIPIVPLSPSITQPIENVEVETTVETKTATAETETKTATAETETKRVAKATKSVSSIKKTTKRKPTTRATRKKATRKKTTKKEE